MPPGRLTDYRRTEPMASGSFSLVCCMLLIMMSGCANDQPTGPSRPVSPSPTANTPTSNSSPSSRPGTPARRTNVTVVMNGDLLWHNTLWYGAKEDAQQRGKGGYDFAPLLAGLKPVIASADLAVCHEEVPLAPPG